MISDRTLSHLREVIQAPDLSGSRYELIEEIGRGGMGTVYLVNDTMLQRRVALKVLNHRDEALTLAALEHPGIVPVHDLGILPDGRTYYAMKLVQGSRLDDYRATAASLPDRLRTFLRICEPVAFAHSRGWIHRDLKPQNIMVSAFGEVLVLDWGVAGRADTKGTTVAGTTGYMAPEQLAGVTDARTDIFSLGKVLEYLLDPNDPKAVKAIAAKASDADSAKRYATVSELSDDVARFLDGNRVLAYRESLLERAGRFLARNRTMAILILTYLIVRTAIFFLTRR